MEPKKKKIAILVPCTEFGPNTFWLNFIPMRDRIMKQGWQITTVLDMSSYPIDIKREMMAERALNEGVDWLLWLDSVTGDTPLLIRRNSKFIDFIEIRELFRNDHDGRYIHVPNFIEIMTRNGWKKINYVYKHTVNKPIIKLAGQYLVKTTPDHCLYKDGNLVSSSDLKEGDILDTTDFIDDNKLETITEDFARLLGFFCGDGSCGIYKDTRTEKGNQYQFKLTNKNKEFLNKYGLILSNHLCDETYLIPDKDEIYHLTLTRKKEATDLFRKMCYTKSGKKKVPMVVLNSNTRIITAFLEGLYDADGDKTTSRKRWSVDDDSYTMIAGVEYLLKKLGRKVHYNLRTDKPNVIKLTEVFKNRKKEGISKKYEENNGPIDVYDIGTEDGTFVGGCGQVIFKNSDMNFPMDLLDQLYLEPPVMVTALIHKKVKPFWPTIYLKQKNPETKKVEYLPGFVDEDDTGFRKIDVCGFAAVLIPAFYFKEMKRPWFKIVRRTYKNAKIIGEDFWYCFSDDKNYVFTNKNITKIGDIKVGDDVFTHVGTNKVHEIFQRDYDGDLVDIDANYSTIKSTPNHPILTKRGWINADELTKDDMVFMPIPQTDGNFVELNLDEFNHKKEYDNKLGWKCGSEPNYLPEIVNIDADLSYLLGILIAEGYISRQTTITMHKKEIGTINKCQQILLDKLNQKSSHKLQGNTLHLVTTSKPLHRFLAKEIGEGARNKHLPTFWASLSKENLAALLRGYFDGDGHIVDEHSYSVTTVSEMLARQVQEALIRLGILSSLRKREHFFMEYKGENKDYGPTWIITIPTCFRKEFLKILYNKEYDKPFTRYGSVEKTKDGFWVKIRNIKREHYTGKVYNLSVIDDNSYIVNGIAVHNCKKVRKMGLPIMVNLDCKVRHGFGDATGFESYMYYRAPKRQDNVYKDDYIKRLDRRVDQLEQQIDTGKLIGQETGRIPDHRQESKIES